MQVIATKNNMNYFKKLLLIAFQMVFFILVLNGQTNSFVRSIRIFVDSSSIKVDSLSIVPSSVTISNCNPNQYEVNCITATIHFLDSSLIGKELFCSYKVLDIDFSKKYFNKSNQLILQKGKVYTPQVLNINNNWLTSYNDESNLETNGAISRGFSIGNNQDFVLNSSLNLQLNGYLAPDIEIKANITDKNIPIQPEGNTRNIQDFDKIFITIDFKNKWQIQAGDIEILKPNSYFLVLSKKILGMELQTQNNWNKQFSLSNKVGGGVSKGKYCKQKLSIVNGRQGPYKLHGNVQNATIVILSGSERVYIDNKLLIRGQDNDYTIDYNMGEITFTSKILITTEKEIHIEYEYSDLSYSKYTLYSFNKFKSEKDDNLTLNVNFFHEQDLTNRSIQPALTDSMKSFMSQLNTETVALYPSVDTSSFYPNEILYLKKDSLVNDTQYAIYEYTTNQNGALYRLTFSFLGLNKGNYKLKTSGTNGRVFYWIAPLNGIPQGDYEPVIQLQTPKRAQVGTIGAEYEISNSFNISSEFAFSNSDQNLFSSLDNKENLGFAFSLNLNHHKWIPSKDTLSPRWQTSSHLGYEYIHKNFQLIESHRNIEFNKDYNLNDGVLKQSGEQMITLSTKLMNEKKGEAHYQANIYSIEKQLFAFRNMLNSSLKWRSLNFKTNSSFLINNDSLSNSKYLRTINQLSKTFKKVEIGISERYEFNKFIFAPLDTLVANSFKYNEAALYFKNNDSLNYKYLVQFKNIITDKVYENHFVRDQIAFEAQTSFEFSPFKNNNVKGNATYRNNRIFDSSGNSKQENFFIGSIDYNARFLKNLITFSTFYEAGSGMEQKKIFTFLKVATGQGTHIWIDYNNNGIEEINEFEISAFQNEANYIKIWITSNEYVNTFNTQLYQVLQIRPSQIWKNKSGFLKLLSRFNNTAVLRITQKNSIPSLLKAINPFYLNEKDSLIVNSNVNITNNLSFNNQSQLWGIDYYFKLNQNKNIVYYGPEGINFKSHECILRGKPFKKLLIRGIYSHAEKNVFSEFFGSRNYTILSNSFKGEIQYTFSNALNFNLSYMYRNKNNVLGHENVKSNELEFEFNYRVVQKGALQIKAKYAYLSSNMNLSGTLSYDMLEGQTNGHNGLWSILYQTKINEYLVIDFQYNGRINESLIAIHTGSLQLKVLF